LLALAAATTCRASGDPTESLAGVHDLSELQPQLCVLPRCLLVAVHRLMRGGRVIHRHLARDRGLQQLIWEHQRCCG